MPAAAITITSRGTHGLAGATPSRPGRDATTGEQRGRRVDCVWAGEGACTFEGWSKMAEASRLLVAPVTADWDCVWSRTVLEVWGDKKFRGKLDRNLEGIWISAAARARMRDYLLLATLE